MISNFTRLFCFLACVLFIAPKAVANSNEAALDPIFHCIASNYKLPIVLQRRFGNDFYVVTPDLNLMMSDGQLFFGGAVFYFSNGRVSNVKFLKFSQEEAERDKKLGINILMKGADTLVEASNVFSGKPVTLDIVLSRNGFAPRDRPDWSGQCRQLNELDAPRLRELKEQAARK